ncbi:hypothetical protein GW915_09530 [bacterium]|nr:hypothetical protein [bacterium]
MIRKISKLLVPALCLTLVVACSGSDDNGIHSEQSSESYSYSFTLNGGFNGGGCETGKQTFHSIPDLCNGLQNSALNNYCAESQREDRFEEQNCPGTFSPTAKSTPSNPPPQKKSNPKASEAELAFQKTLAFGTNVVNERKMQIIVEKVEALSGKVLSTQKVECFNSEFRLVGNFPSLSYTAPSAYRCDKEIEPFVMMAITLASGVKYKATHLPAGDLKEQFRLSFEGFTGAASNTKNILNVTQARSLNAVLHKDSAFMDLVIDIESLYFNFGKGSMYLETIFKRNTTSSYDVEVEGEINGLRNGDYRFKITAP